RGQASDTMSEPPFLPEAVFLLDWLSPRSWHRALARVREFGSEALVLPWLHPVLAPPYAYLLRRAPRHLARVVICHNVLPHEALALVDPKLRVRLTVAGRFWEGGSELRRQAERLGLNGRLELRDGFVPNQETAVLFAAADASLLPYRSASQSGVVQLSFAY